jgi:hypothetical protein
LPATIAEALERCRNPDPAARPALPLLRERLLAAANWG